MDVTSPAPEADWLTPLLAKIAEISDDTLRDWVLSEVLDALPHCDGADVRVPRGGVLAQATVTSPRRC